MRSFGSRIGLCQRSRIALESSHFDDRKDPFIGPDLFLANVRLEKLNAASQIAGIGEAGIEHVLPEVESWFPGLFHQSAGRGSPTSRR